MSAEVIFTGMMVDPGAVAFRNFGCSVRGAGIHNDHFVDEVLAAVEATAKIVLFILYDHAEIDPWCSF